MFKWEMELKRQLNLLIQEIINHITSFSSNIYISVPPFK